MSVKVSRRKLLQAAAGSAALPALGSIARAQRYPARPIRLVLGYAPGAAPDIVCRLMGQWLAERLGQPFVVENRPGAGSNLGTEMVVRAPADGYTLLYTTTANATNATLYEHLNFNFIRDIVPIAGVIRVPNLVTVNPSLPIASIPQLIEVAKAQPGTLNFGAANGGTVQLSGELFKMMTGVNIVHVPYRSQAQATTDVMAGRLQVSFDVMPTTIAYVRDGKLRALGVTTAARSPALPDVPAVAEFVPSYEASSWHGLCAPKNTPRDIVDLIGTTVKAILDEPQNAARLAQIGGTPMPMAPAEFAEFIAAETEKWAKVIKFAGAKID
jgi:tripartite-type tricarboxylate transporter receptor subunit TctC